MITTSEKKQKSYFSPAVLATDLAKAFERVGATPDEIHDIARKGNENLVCQFLKIYRENQRIAEAEKTSHLAFHNNVNLPKREQFCPKEYFQTRRGLYVCVDFRDRILSVTKKTGKLPSAKITSYNIVKDSNNEKIRAELSKNHIWKDASDFCSHLAGMIDRQPKGENGDLLNNGCVNIFYVRGKNGEVFAVNVYWGVGALEWYVNAYQLDDGLGPAGRQAFSRNSIFAS